MFLVLRWLVRELRLDLNGDTDTKEPSRMRAEGYNNVHPLKEELDAFMSTNLLNRTLATCLLYKQLSTVLPWIS